MKNVWIGHGRLTKDPEVRYTQQGTAIASFTLAVDRDYKKEGQPSADFINCVAWGKTAETIGNYLKKGSETIVEGRIQVRSYEKDGAKRWITEVVVGSFDFCGSKKDGDASVPQNEPIAMEEEIPF